MTLQETAERALEIVRSEPIIAYDVETSGLDWKRNYITGYVITSPSESLYVPVRHAGGGNLADPKCPAPTEAVQEVAPHWFDKALADAFAIRVAHDYLTVGHHIKFDMLFSFKHGIDIGRNVYDTQNMATMLDEYQKSFSLEHTAIVMQVTPKLSGPMYEHLAKLFGGTVNKNQMANYWRTSGTDPMVVDYAAGDGVTTLEVYRKQLPHIELERMTVICDIENRLIRTLAKMEFKGWKLAVDRFDEVIAKADAMLEEARAKLPQGFSVRSPAAVRALCERTGNTNWPLTAGGAPSFKEEFLTTFEEGRNILRVRRIEKLKSSFIIPLRDAHMFNGRVHGNLNQLRADASGTISGRMSASHPNLQQIPARDPELATLIRMLFIADEGMRLYEADYSQQEPRFWAHYSHDAYLTEGYRANPPRDVHTVCAELIEVSRKLAKNINLGLFYLMGKTSFHRHMSKFHPGVGRDETDRMHDAWYSNFTDVKRFQNEATSVFRNRGWVRTYLGRRARTDGSNKHYVAPNRIIQGSSADMTKAKLLEIDLYFETLPEGVAYLLMTVHDSIIFETEDSERGRAIAAEVERIMTDVNDGPLFKLEVPFTVDMTSGLDWAEVKFGAEE